jgi:phosphoglucomutase
MSLHALAGHAAPAEILVDLRRLEDAYFAGRPDPADPAQRVAFGTSGHRGSSLDGSFTQAHVLAIVQAVCDYRAAQGIAGPLYLGMDTHALSALAHRSALEVLAANGVHTVYQQGEGVTPTPVVSRAILAHNRTAAGGLADGLLVTPSHNPPEDGGIKYNPPDGGPADTDVTAWIQDRANALLGEGNRAVRRVPLAAALQAPQLRAHDFVPGYLRELASVLDIDAIRGAGLRLGVDPLGGSALPYWQRLGECCGIAVEVVNAAVDPRFGFMSVDHDGRIRMDCSSPHAMAQLVKLKDRFDVAFGNDPDADRHGIVTPAGLMNPNHYLAVAIDYLLGSRDRWPAAAAVGKTLVSSSLIDRVVASHGRVLSEMPVGFKWFAPGLHAGTVCFGGEESAGASFLRHDGSAWTTDKDGILLCLLAAEITARTGKDPGVLYRELTDALGTPYYTRIDAPATPAEKAALKKLAPAALGASTLAGEPILATLDRAPANDAPIGGLKVVTANGWFCARPSGTENIVKIYAESFSGEDHLQAIVAEARGIVASALKR